MRGNASARVVNADARRREVRALRSRGEIVPPLRGSGEAGTPRKRRVSVGLFCSRARGGRLGRVFPRARIAPAGTDLSRRFARRGSERQRRGTTPRTPCVSMGKNGQPKRKKKEPRRGGTILSVPAGQRRNAAGRRKKQVRKCVCKDTFFFVRIADKEMRQGSAGCSRRVSFPKIT